MKMQRLFEIILAHPRQAILTGLTMLGVAALCTTVPVPRAQADQEITRPEAIAELDQLLADFHGALSYGGNITAMMNLWAPDCTLTLNGVSHVGKNAVQTFFTGSGYFLNDWVSLAPEYKTEIAVSGNQAVASTQCVAVDVSVNPPVFKSVTQVNATMERRKGQWVFTSMNNSSPAPL